MLDFCKDIREVAEPGALFLNYANPNGDEHLGRASSTAASTPSASATACRAARDQIAAGARRQGRQRSRHHLRRHQPPDLVHPGPLQGPKIDSDELLAAFERHPVYSQDGEGAHRHAARFGYYSTESNGHLSEYVPWYRKRPEEITQLDRPERLDQRRDRRLPARLHRGPQLVRDRLPASGQGRGRQAASAATSAPASTAATSSRRWRPAASIAATSTSATTAASRNLPDDCDRRGPRLRRPQRHQHPAASATCRWPARRPARRRISVQRMARRGGGRPATSTLLKQAMLQDPLTGAVCNPDEIWQMVDEMLVAQAQWLPQYADAIPAAKKRLRTPRSRPATGRAPPARPSARSRSCAR